MSRVVRLVLLLVACACTPGAALAQKYPVKPIRVIVPLPAGDTCDIFARLIGQRAAERLGQQFVVDNRVGASG